MFVKFVNKMENIIESDVFCLDVAPLIYLPFFIIDHLLISFTIFVVIFFVIHESLCANDDLG